nr:anti sigma factor C-terminal domain-containing protein [Paenibacillus sp. MMS18-CY102]
MNDNEASFDDNIKLAALIKKARNRTIWRNIIISLTVMLFILVGGWFVNLQLQYRSADNAMRDIEMFEEISGPNHYLSGYRTHYGFLSGTLEYQTYKIVEGVPVVWEPENYEFSSWGTFTRSLGNYSSLSVQDTAMQEQGFQYTRPYNRYSSEREMMFYLPSVEYANYLNETPELNAMNGQKLVEMALSFDTNYSVKQIQSMLPTDVHPVWYWVDTYKPMIQQLPDGTVLEPNPDLAGSVYGFGIRPDNPDVTEQKFLDALENGIQVKGKYKQEYERIYDYLRDGKEKPTIDGVRVIGVVVTGTANRLKALQGQTYVKAAVLGAIIDKY